MPSPSPLITNCKKLLAAYKNGALGQTKMPEDSNPGHIGHAGEQIKNSDPQFTREFRLAYFTLPMALNYQRDSYTLWQNALKTWQDKEARQVFDVQKVADMPMEKLRALLLRHKLALQPNKHITTWKTIANTIAKTKEWGSMANFIDAADGDFLALKNLVQQVHKKGFPYLSGPKIFNYWSFILGEYAGVTLKNREYIEIAPDTHVTQCSVRLGIISKNEAGTITKDELSARWRHVLKDSGITPIEMHPPLWFWSKNGFIYEL